MGIESFVEVVAVVFVIVSLAVGSLWFAQWRLAAKTLEYANSAISSAGDCHEQIEEMRVQIARIDHEKHELELAVDEWVKENTNLKIKVDKLESEISKQKKEADEIIDVSYIMLQWIKNAVIRFEALEAEPPKLPREILLFEQKYHGRFNKGD